MPQNTRMTAVIGGFLLAACGDGTAPGATTPSAAVRVSSVRIEGPSSIAPGASAVYRLIGSFEDGTTRDVSSEASWTSSSNDAGGVLIVAGGGLVTGGTRGEADLIARYPATDVNAPGIVSSRIPVLVLEAGTFRVAGRVTESGVPLSTARVAVLAGIGAGQTTGLRFNGEYALYGLAGDVTLEVSEESFQTQTLTLIVNDHQTVDVNLQPLLGYAAVTGEWRLSMRAAPSCGSDIPEEAATRTFQVNVSQRGSALTLMIASATTVRDAPHSAFGGVGPERMDFYLQKFPDEIPPGFVLLEMLESGQFLGIAGNARGVRSGNTVLGTLSGEFSLYRAAGTTYRAPGTTLERSCRRLTNSAQQTNETHTFRLDRN